MNPDDRPRVAPAERGELAAIRALLADSRLPTEDLDGAADLRFWVVRDGERLCGAIGLERHGDAALLRSLVVDPDYRQRGLGAALVARVEQEASAAGVRALVLLTQTAAAFFGARGYAHIERASAPASVQASAEFRSLCPASAVCMSKSLR